MSDKPTPNDLVLVKLSDVQMALAKQANPHRRKITHALLCGTYGQMLGTEKQCRKYYSAWKDIFRRLFDKVYETEMHPIQRYESTLNLVMLLIQDASKAPSHSPAAARQGWPDFSLLPAVFLAASKLVETRAPVRGRSSAAL